MINNMLPTARINVGPTERLASILSGVGLILTAVSRPSKSTFTLALGGGYLLYRGLSGHCLVYEALEIRRAEAEGGAGIKVSRSFTINRPKDEVYRFWRDFENLPRFMAHLQEVQIQPASDGGKRSHWVAKGPMDSRIEWDAEIVEERPDELIAWRSLPGSEVENSGTVRFRDAPAGRGTEVHVSLKYNPPGGSASAAVAKLFGEEPSRQVREDLRRFKQVIETGETATVLGQTSGRIEQTEAERQEIGRRKRKDIVQKASEDSFPASDPPPWTSGPE